ncbi:DEAD/DEAH box helicase family protein [Clostridium baratii]|uniref:DEAD/DEAH box helicase n=1 Tax=Clostridium baratii TaxID=1561 RepID=UPI0030CA8047
MEWISNVIGEDYKKWNKGDVVTIKAQTGTGKTYFIIGDKHKKGFIDKIDSKEKVLYLCNRLCLERQIKLELLKKFDMDIKYKGKEIDLQWLDKIEYIKNVTVTTYHKIASEKLDNQYRFGTFSLSEFQYIISDECHFFLTDSSFMNKSYLVYDELIKKPNTGSIRIFISATIEEFNQIMEEDLSIKGKGYKYNQKEDYSHLNVKYFKSLKDIFQTIKNDKSGDKWLIFVTNKDKGKEFKDKLNKFNIKAEFIYANTENDEKRNIISTNSFKSKVLITTKCLDNGINIKDKEVKNLVVIAFDKVTFIQEIGRKRVDINNPQQVNLYIPMLGINNFNMVLKNQNKKFETIELFKNDIEGFKIKYNHNPSYPKDIFYLDENNIYRLNQLGERRLIEDYKFTKSMKESIGYDKFAYVKEQLKWLGLSETFNEDNLIENVVDIEEIETLEDYLKNINENDIRLDKEDFIKDIDKIIKSKLGNSLEELLIKLDNNKRRRKGLKQYNKLFSLLELPYVVGSKKFKIKGKKVTKWIVIKKE